MRLEASGGGALCGCGGLACLFVGALRCTCCLRASGGCRTQTRGAAQQRSNWAPVAFTSRRGRTRRVPGRDSGNLKRLHSRLRRLGRKHRTELEKLGLKLASLVAQQDSHSQRVGNLEKQILDLAKHMGGRGGRGGRGGSNSGSGGSARSAKRTVKG